MDPLPFLAFALIAVIVLVLSARHRKQAQSPPVQTQPPVLPSFLFSELQGPPSAHIRVIRTKVRGVTYENFNGIQRQDLIRSSCHPGDALLLLRQPDNPFDPNAIAAIRVCRGPKGAEFREQIGYLSKEIARELAPTFDDGPVGIAEILEITGDIEANNERNVGIRIRADIYMPDQAVSAQSS